MNSVGDEIPNIPLPTEVPPPPRLQDIPREVLHSNTVEALLSQNEDLMARLTITLRRNSELETRYFSMKESHQKMMNQNDSLIDEVGILREKSKHLDRLYQAMKSERDQLEARFGEHYAQTQESNLQLRAQIQILEQQLRRNQKYRHAVQTRVRRLIDRQNKKIQDLEADLHRRLDSALHTETRLNETRERLAKAYTHIENQTREYESDLSKLSEQFEDKIQALTSALQQAESEIQVLRLKQRDLQERNQALIEKEVLADNRAILAERKRDEVLRRHQDELAEVNQRFQEELRLRTTFETQFKDSRTELKNLQSDTHASERARISAEQNVESLTALYQSTLKNLEATKEREAAAQALNKELTSSLEKYRKELESVHLDRVERDLVARQAQKQLESRVQNLATAKSDTAAIAEARVPNPQIMNRIEALFTEIESQGYGRTSGAPIQERLETSRGKLEDLV